MANPSYLYGSFNFNDNISYYVLGKPYDIVPYAQTTFKIARLEGVKKTGEVVNDRTIQVKIRVLGTSRVSLEQNLQALYQAFSLRQQNLVLYATDSRYYVADCVSASAPLAGGMPISTEVTATFVCQMPWSFAASPSTHSTGATTLTGGSGVWSFPVQTFAGGGSIYSRPQIRITSNQNLSWTAVTVLQQTDNETLSIAGSANLPTISGDYVDIFCDPNQTNGYTCQKNSSGTPLPFTGIFPVQEPTSTSWLIQINAVSAPQATAVWTFTSRWMV